MELQKHLYNSEEENATTIDLLDHRSNLDLIRKAAIKEIFGKEEIKEVELSDIFNLKLERHASNKLKKKRIVSISKKYQTIPHEFISYYPVNFDEENQVEKGDKDEDDNDTKSHVIVDPKSISTKQQKSALMVNISRKVGRPKQLIVKTPPIKTILSFFPKIDPKK